MPHRQTNNVVIVVVVVVVIIIIYIIFDILFHGTIISNSEDIFGLKEIPCQLCILYMVPSSDSSHQTEFVITIRL